jgi:excisionase family DNA binding protein
LGTIFDIEGAAKLQKHYRIKDVAEICAVSQKTVYRWIYDGKLRPHRIGGNVRVPKTELLKFIRPLDDMAEF